MSYHHQYQQQQVFLPLPVKDKESHPHDLLLHSVIYGQSGSSQSYLDDELDSILMDQQLANRLRALSNDFSVSPIKENPGRHLGHNIVGPLPPAPPLWQSAPIPNCVPAPHGLMRNKSTDQLFDTKAFHTCSYEATPLPYQTNVNFVHKQDTLPSNK